MTVKFDKDDNKNYEVLVNEDNYGKLTFDDEQQSWVLWPNDLDDGVTYFEELEETKEAITDDINNYKEEN